MAASGYTPISLYYSTTASAVPTAGNLANGELGLNIADMKLYAKNSSGVVTLLASNASTTGVDSLSFGSTGLTPSTATTGAITVAGTLNVANGGTGKTSYTANGVLYASGTGTLANGSALTFDGSRIALGTATSNIQLTTTVNTNQAYISLADADGRTAVFRGPNSGSPNCAQIGTVTNHDTAFLYGNTEQMRLTSTGLGIGTTTVTGRITAQSANAANTSWAAYLQDSNAAVLFNVRGDGLITTATTGSLGPYNYTTASAPNMYVNSSGQLLRSTASVGTVTSITVAAGTGMSGGGTVTTSGTVTLTNAGVTSVTAGTGISVSASTGGVTITSTVASGSQAFLAFGSTGGF